MVTKKRTTTRRAAPRRAAPRRAAPRRRAKSGTQYIPGAAATVALVVAEAPRMKELYKAVTNNGKETAPAKMIKRIQNNDWTHKAMKNFVTVDNLATAGLAIGGGYIAGEVLKKYAPGVIKRPLGKLAKKIPKVI